MWHAVGPLPATLPRCVYQHSHVLLVTSWPCCSAVAGVSRVSPCWLDLCCMMCRANQASMHSTLTACRTASLANEQMSGNLHISVSGHCLAAQPALLHAANRGDVASQRPHCWSAMECMCCLLPPSCCMSRRALDCKLPLSAMPTDMARCEEQPEPDVHQQQHMARAHRSMCAWRHDGRVLQPAQLRCAYQVRQMAWQLLVIARMPTLQRVPECH